MGLARVLRQERLTAHQGATVPAEGQKPVPWEGQERQVALREVRDLKLGEDDTEPVRAVLSDESWVQTRRIPGRRVSTPRSAHRGRIATPELDPYPPEAIWRMDHPRWGIENHAGNELIQHDHLHHCPITIPWPSCVSADLEFR